MVFGGKVWSSELLLGEVMCPAELDSIHVFCFFVVRLAVGFLVEKTQTNRWERETRSKIVYFSFSLAKQVLKTKQQKQRKLKQALLMHVWDAI